MSERRDVPDPATARILEAVAALGLPQLHSMSPQAARTAFAVRVQSGNVLPEVVQRVDDLHITTRDGEALHLRRYQAAEGDGQPLLLYFHGGGFVIGSVDTHDPICRYLAARSGCSVISVDYRLAPEHRYPTAVHDALDAFEWVWANADTLQIDLQRVAVAGDSAGGTLAAVVAQHARRQGRSLLHQVLFYPALDQGGAYPSRQYFGDKFLLTQDAIRWYAQHYYGHGQPELHPDASPARSEDLEGLAPATIITAELDPLRDEAAHYAAMLEAAGVKTRYRCVEGVIHGFLGMARHVPAALRQLEHVAEDLRAEFGVPYGQST